MLTKTFKPSPWDAALFGTPAYEILQVTPETLELASKTPGHYTVKIDPLASKQLLNQYGFYYCDTLVEPHCSKEHFQAFSHTQVSVSRNPNIDALLEIAHGAFQHGRFHRDFQIANLLADQRYDQWLTQLYQEGKVYGLLYERQVTGFIAVNDNHLVLHAVSPNIRGQGLAKYLWMPICQRLFSSGHSEITSSISMANLAALNLYTSLGFRFRHAQDIYHRMTK